ncbi:MAG: hypothetical protein AAF899_08965 [Pseudomonadota bacterium]
MDSDISLPGRERALPAPIEAAAGLRNGGLDAMLYGIAGLTGVERGLLSLGTGTPGAVVHARPGRSIAPGIRVFRDAARFMASDDGETTQLAVPGGGGSELAAAALARQLADATGRPAAAVVPGYGRQDALAELLGGAVLFAPMSRLRTALGTLGRQAVLQAASARMPGRRLQLADDAMTAPAAAALMALMGDAGRRLDLVVAHAQGVLALSAAFARLLREGRGTRAAQAQVLTLSAPTAFPPAVRWLRQVRGALDPLAILNAEREIAHEVLPFTGHHLNPGLPGHIDLARQVEALGGMAV